ncbi:MAG: hypothetical protein AAGD15_01680 [Agrobacterium cavarae]|uniref:hypothetical protein n=1 Tax=Agrobacterium cavarae TaxID=2528239 RepID=UPI0031B4C4EE
MKCHFVVRQKVVCIDADWYRGFSPLVEGMTYTIKSVGFGMGTNPDGTISQEASVELIEQENPDDENSRIPLRIGKGFRASLFRPMAQRKTDISIFKAMLNPSRTEVPA